MKQRRLFEQFPPVTTQEWIDKINSDLKGADFNKRLVWKTSEGFDVRPFYRSEDIENLWSVDTFIPLYFGEDFRGSSRDNTVDFSNNWLVRQDIHVSDYSEANRKALSVLMKGIDSLGFIIEDPETVNKENVKKLLTGIHPAGAEINLLSNGKARELVQILSGIFKEDGFSMPVLRGAVEADPISRLMLNGTLCIPVEAGFDYLASLTKDNLILPNFRNIQINGSNLVNAGAGVVMELALSISMAVEYLSQLTGRGIKADDIAAKMRFSFGIGSNYFMEISKLRAARIIWSLIADAYGFKDKGSSRMEIHSITGKWNKTIYDPYVNMLRTQTEAMSAILGGTDSLTVNPFDLTSGMTSEFSERIARNQQLILKEEAYFNRVADPASGSYYIENLTALVAENSWKLFVEMEEKGGFISALKSGIIQDMVEKSATERKANLSRRKEVLVGTNQFPDPKERYVRDSIKTADPDKKSFTDDMFIRPVRTGRGSEDFERIRMSVDNAIKRPSVFLLSVGNHVMRRARAQFSAGFFGCAGYNIIDNEGYENVRDGTEEALNSSAEIVVICSSDEEYPVYGPQILERIGTSSIVVIAGNPPDIENLKNIGLKNYINMRSDLIETLDYYNSCLGIN